MSRRFLLFLSGVIMAVPACTSTYNPLEEMHEVTPSTPVQAPDVELRMDIPYSPEQVSRGEYIVALLGCSSCHTDGALVGTPDYQRHLAGSRTGIAYSNPLRQPNPGVVYPPNLTPDENTGIGMLSDDAIIRQIRTGVSPDGGHSLPVMPWPAYSTLSDEDVNAIVAYLRSLPPVSHRVPENVAPGQRATAPYVHFGVYQSRR